MDHILSDLLALWTQAWLMSLATIILIDIIMSWDNAIIIWMATKDLDPKYRKKAIMIWIFLATIFRIILAFFTVFLLSIVWIKLAGWLLLLYVVWKFYKELRVWTHEEHWTTVKKVTFMSAISTIIVADISMSLDNVLAVAWAAHDNIAALGIGLIFSIILMAFASNYIAKNLNKYPQIQWVWLLVILFVAVEMILNWTADLDSKLHIPNLLPFSIFLIWALFVVLHQKYIKPVSEESIKNYLSENYLKVIIANLSLVLILIFLWDKVTKFLHSNHALQYSLIFIIIWLILELFSILKGKRKK
jgi:YjbE family integral membrane protein